MHKNQHVNIYVSLSIFDEVLFIKFFFFFFLWLNLCLLNSMYELHVQFNFIRVVLKKESLNDHLVQL
jgi:hypothetical protein